CGFGMALLPARQSGERLGFAFRAPDLDQRMRRGAALGGLHPWGLAGLLPVMRRPRRVAFPFALVACRELEQGVEGPGARIDSFVGIADLGEALRHGRQREV